MDNITSFFNEYNIESILFSCGNKNLSIDGTGILPSVNKKIAKNILYYIKNFYPDCKTILDIGSGVGYLSKISQDIPELEIQCYSFEGCKDLIPYIKCSPHRCSIVDLSKKFGDERLKKQFDLTTSFEVLEHIHRTHQDTFWENLRYFSKGHLCSIHVANQEDDNHCCIRPLNEWLDYLKDKGEVTILGRYPEIEDNDDSNCNFRKEIIEPAIGPNAHLRDPTAYWGCSIMLYIKFK